ncbi:MAG: hypothetical protein FWC35_05040, partial [Proteobacteria bacterium]|nr:hypothetical protein [Pseudomonadota bacterium]
VFARQTMVAGATGAVSASFGGFLLLEEQPAIDPSAANARVAARNHGKARENLIMVFVLPVRQV